MNQLGPGTVRTNDNFSARSEGFWRRQFEDAPTGSQVRFDVTFGIAAPVLCFIFDPIVFRGGFSGGGILQQFQFFAYAFSAIEIVALISWLLFGRRATKWAGLASGILHAGALFSFTLGVLILPLSLLGLMLFVGVFGFVPFATALVYLRNGRRALRLAQSSDAARAGVAASLAFGFALALCVPIVAHWGAKRTVASAIAEVLESGSLSPAKARTLRLLTRATGATYDEVVWAYQKETDPTRRTQLAKAYAEITSNDIEQRLMRLMD